MCLAVIHDDIYTQSEFRYNNVYTLLDLQLIICTAFYNWIHTCYCNDKEQDCFSPLSYYSATEHHVQLQKKSNIQKSSNMCNTVITTGMLNEYNKHNATIKHYTIYTTEKFTKINAFCCSCTSMIVICKRVCKPRSPHTHLYHKETLPASGSHVPCSLNPTP